MDGYRVEPPAGCFGGAGICSPPQSVGVGIPAVNRATALFFCYDGKMAKRKTTVYLDADLLAAVKVLSASTGRRDYEVMEEALRFYMRRPEVVANRERLRDLLDRVADRSALDGEEALSLAYGEIKDARKSRRSKATVDR